MHGINDKSSNTGVTKSLQHAIRVFEALFEDGFAGKSVPEIVLGTGGSQTSIWRALQTLEALGWVVQVPEPGTKRVRWRVSTKMAAIAAAYEQHALRRVHEMRREYMDVTGKELRA